jgi:hypothetical protein
VALLVALVSESISGGPEIALRRLLAASELAEALRGLELLALGGDPSIRLRYRPGGDWYVRVELPIDQLTLILASLEDWRHVAPNNGELLAEMDRVFGKVEKWSE